MTRKEEIAAIRGRAARTFWRWRVTIPQTDFDRLCELAESEGNPNARLYWDEGKQPSTGGYPAQIWFTPEDNSSVAYVRADLAQPLSDRIEQLNQGGSK